MNASSDGYFATTRWTVVRAAGQESAAALESLCSIYWMPLYAYVRRHGFGREDAEDLTQAFFSKLLEKKTFETLRQENGRFRAFLLVAMKHFLANERDRAGRLKRGGHITHFSLDWQQAEDRLEIADTTQISPDAAYDREWAMALLERVVTFLRDECDVEGKGDRFEQLKCYLSVGKGEIPYASAAASLAMEEGTVRVLVHRLRKRYRQLLRNEVGHTLADPKMVDEELAALMTAFQ